MKRKMKGNEMGMKVKEESSLEDGRGIKGRHWKKKGKEEIARRRRREGEETDP